MSKTRRLQSNFSKGELSPLLEGMPDLAAYFEGGKTIENWLILRQGGLTRWPGSRFIAEVKDSTKDAVLIPFEFSVDDAYILEFGNLSVRVYKNKAPVLTGGVPVEVVSPYVDSQLRSIHNTQSADVLFLFHPNVAQQELGRVSDISWSMNPQRASPPPSFEQDTNLGCLMGLGANTGLALPFRLSAASLLAADVGRQLIAGAGRAIITALTDAQSGVADVLDDFSETITAGPNTLTSVGTGVTSTAHGLHLNDCVRLTSGAQAGELRVVTHVLTGDAVTLDAAFSVDQSSGVTWNKIVSLASGAWLLRASPQTTLDPNVKEPIGAQVTLVAGAAAFRSGDVGKFLHLYGGVVKITVVDSPTQVRGELMSVMGEAVNADPTAVPAGAWTLETSSWTVTNGFPRTGEFFQGRLYQAATAAQPTTFWGSRSDDFDNYAIGITAEDAVEYPMASRQLNRIEWITEKGQGLYLGTSGTEHNAIGSGNANAVIGGDTIPLLTRLATNGCFPAQPITARKSILYIDRSRRKVIGMNFDVVAGEDSDVELSVGAEHITKSKVRLGALAYQKRLNPRLYFVREDGTLVAMTFYPEQKVVAFSRRVTQGTYESVAVIPQATGESDQVWVIVKRTINGVVKRYVEMFEEDHEDLSGRAWTSMQTDCGIVVTGITGLTVTGLDYLEGKTVDVVKNGSALAQEVVTGGAITLGDALAPADVLEIGLHYESTYESMRPGIPGQVIEGLPRSWDSLFVRVHDSKGGTLKGEPLLYPITTSDEQDLYTGDLRVSQENWDTDGRIVIQQTQPYPLTVLCAFGTLSLGEKD